MSDDWHRTVCRMHPAQVKAAAFRRVAFTPTAVKEDVDEERFCGILWMERA